MTRDEAMTTTPPELGAMVGRVPPNDLEAEAVVLSALLLHPPSWQKVNGLAPEHFYSSANRYVFHAALDLRNAGKAVDLVSVAGHLRDNDKLQAAGGTAYLAQVTDATPSVANVDQHAARITELWRRRQLIQVCQMVAAEGYASTTPTAELRQRLDVVKWVPQAENGFVFMSEEELWGELQPPPWVIDGIVREGGVFEIVAYAGSSKTWLGDDAAIAVASGQQWLKRFPTRQGNSALIDWENGSYETRRRVHLIADGRQLDTPVPGFDVCVLPPIYLTSPEAERELLRISVGRALIVIDTFRAACPGVDENDSDVRQYIDMLRRVGNVTGCAFLILVHAKKSSGNAAEIDPREMARGSSAIIDAPDLALLLTYQGEGKPALVQQIKARQGKAVDPFFVELVDLQSAGGGLIVLGRDPEQKEQSLGQAERRIVEWLGEHPGSTGNRISQELGLKPAKVRAALEAMAESGRVRSEDRKGKGGGTVWSV